MDKMALSSAKSATSILVGWSEAINIVKDGGRISHLGERRQIY